ncbi:hypothetical protein CB0940_08799 [Cercospora beticola]|uniref:SRR1-like domain-containing protein n=1 Tax=Cercospora beticola TaxID=122368 RepID=A0A2G5HPR9_CERBT|nr:hypothetical protein CB0940_08799 [Cercospora beticola]PIA94253.1 hypothetical protein CB0940_08799 [Cercospora beticola]WPB05385.1 hypothetical protein RHO25_010037 [Cercospora beticola]CAK1365187.1 unnamed protein product [Cercospora beticola]
MASATNNEWTSVPSRKGKKSRPSQAQPVSHGHANGPPPVSRDLTMSDIKRDFDTKRKQWKKTECRKQLLKLVDWVLDARGPGRMEKFVCLGSGSLSRDNVECRRRSLWQVVVFWDLVEYVRGQQEKGEDVEGGDGVWVSDPAYTELDREYFKTLGIKVVDVDRNAKGLGEVREYLGEGTLLFEPFVDMNADMMRDLVERDVGIYVGSSAGGLQKRGGELGELAKKFGSNRTMRRFPVFEVDPNVFDGMELYWKEESED